MVVYIDSECKCHVSPGEGFRELDVPFFDGKCAEFIQGYRFVPDGETWTDKDGVEYSGRSPWQPYEKLYIAQLEYELADADAALTELGVTYDA